MSIYKSITEGEIETCSRVFHDLDEDERGWINQYELKIALERVNIQFPYDNAFYKLISELEDQSGKITF